MKKMKTNKKYARNILSIIFENGVSSDQITLIGGLDNQRVLIHRNVLMACSKYFTAALGPNFNGNGETEFVFDETDGPMLKAIVDFCYTGLIDLTEKNVLKYLAVSDSVELDLLNEKCRQFVGYNMTANDAVATFVIADKYRYHELRQKAFDLICETFEKIPTLRIDGLDWRLMQEILKNDNLRATEIHILDRLLEWFRGDESGRGQHMVELLKLVRLEYLRSQFLHEKQLEAIYKRFNFYEALLAEREMRLRVSKHCLNDGRRRPRSIFCLLEGEDVLHIERYNSESRIFEDAAEINVGDRKLYRVQLFENNVYVLGGWNNTTLKSVSRFDLITGREEVLPEMNEARANSASIILGMYIYVFGGANTKSCERFDMETMTWTMLKPMSLARIATRAIALDGYIYVISGMSHDSNSDWAMPDVYDPACDEWHQLAALQSPRAATLFKSSSILYAIGHGSNERNSTLERYDASVGRWTQVGSLPDMIVDNSVTTADGIFVKRSDWFFGKLDIGVNDICSFQQLAQLKHEQHSFFFREVCLVEN